MVTWIKAFDEMHLKTNKYPMITTPFGWWNTCTGNSSAFATTNPFWLDSYTSSPPASIPAGTATWTMWQSASSGTFPGGQDQFNGPYGQSAGAGHQRRLGDGGRRTAAPGTPGAELAEGPALDPAEQCLSWVDIRRRPVHRWWPATILAAPRRSRSASWSPPPYREPPAACCWR